MFAERAVKGISRDYRKFARQMAIIKNRMDRAQMLYDAREEGHAEGRNEERQYLLEMLDQGLSIEEIKQRLKQ
jgi:hypothetical protein